MNQDQERFVTLWTDYLEGDLDATNMDDLKTLADDNPEFATLAVEIFRTHRLLGMLSQERNWRQDDFVRETMAMLPGEHNAFVDDVMNQLQPEPTKTPKRSNWVFLTIVAAALAIACGILWQLQQIQPRTIATITAMDGEIQWTGDGGRVQPDLRVGSELYGGVMETLTHDTWVECTFEDGTKVTIAGNSLVTLSEYEQQKTVYLREGNLSADVAKQPIGKPMRVMTRTAEAEVLGTQFLLSSEPQETQLTVNEGLVRVKRLADGSVQDVAANQSIVAALEKDTKFATNDRKTAVHGWKAIYPGDVSHGKHVDQQDGQSYVAATPLLWGENREVPILLHVVTSRAAKENRPPLVLTDNSRVRITGSIESAAEVMVGVTAIYQKGGFAGKYKTTRKIEVPANNTGKHHTFSIETSILDLLPEEKRFPKTAADLQVFDCWVLTVHNDHKLRIHSIEFKELGE